MNVAEVRAAIRTRWLAQWPLLHSSDPTDATYFPFCFEREKFTEPNTYRPDGITPQLWARISLRSRQSRQETLGPIGVRKYERHAHIWCQIFGPEVGNADPFDAAVVQIQTIYEGVEFGGEFGVKPSQGSAPYEVGSDGRWFQVALVIPVTYYETR